MDRATSLAPLPYDRLGTGRPLLLLHGALVDRNYWQLQRDRLAAHYDVIACDLPGHGANVPLTGPTSVAAFAEAVLATLDALNLPSVLCLGHSLGGMVAQELALRAPERIEALIIADSWYNPRGDLWEPFPFRTVGLKWMLELLPVATMVELMASGLALSNPAIAPYARQTMQRYIGDRNGYLRIWDASIDFDTSDRLHQISCPTLVVVSDSYLFTRYQAFEMQRRIPGASLAVISQSSHWVNWDNPAAFEEAVLAFLAGL